MRNSIQSILRNALWILIFASALSACSRRAVAPGSAPSPPIVRAAQTERVELHPIDDTYQASGTLRSRSTTSISSHVSATISEFPVREGQLVKAGQVLVVLDSREARNSLEQSETVVRKVHEAVNEANQAIAAARAVLASAEANRRLAESTLSRYRELFDRKSVSPQEFDEVKARYDLAVSEYTRDASLLQVALARQSQAQAAVDQASADVNRANIAATYFRINAPTSGVVSARLAEVGATAMPGSPLLTLEDASNYRLEAQVEESRSRSIHIGDRVKGHIDALGDVELDGKVAEIVPAADPGSHTYTVKVAFPFRGGMRSGLFGVASFSSGEIRRAITVPFSAIITRGQVEYLFVVDSGGVVRQRLVRTGKRFGDRVEILSGLQDSERIVTSNVEKVSEGSRVE